MEQPFILVFLNELSAKIIHLLLFLTVLHNSFYLFNDLRFVIWEINQLIIVKFLWFIAFFYNLSPLYHPLKQFALILASINVILQF